MSTPVPTDIRTELDRCRAIIESLRLAREAERLRREADTLLYRSSCLDRAVARYEHGDGR